MFRKISAIFIATLLIFALSAIPVLAAEPEADNDGLGDVDVDLINDGELPGDGEDLVDDAGTGDAENPAETPTEAPTDAPTNAPTNADDPTEPTTENSDAEDGPDVLLWIIIAAGAILVIIIIAVLVSKKK